MRRCGDMDDWVGGFGLGIGNREGRGGSRLGGLEFLNGGGL